MTEVAKLKNFLSWSVFCYQKAVKRDVSVEYSIFMKETDWIKDLKGQNMLLFFWELSSNSLQLQVMG